MNCLHVLLVLGIFHESHSMNELIKIRKRDWVTKTTDLQHIALTPHLEQCKKIAGLARKKIDSCLEICPPYVQQYAYVGNTSSNSQGIVIYKFDIKGRNANSGHLVKAGSKYMFFPFSGNHLTKNTRIHFNCYGQPVDKFSDFVKAFKVGLFLEDAWKQSSSGNTGTIPAPAETAGGAAIMT